MFFQVPGTSVGAPAGSVLCPFVHAGATKAPPSVPEITFPPVPAAPPVPLAPPAPASPPMLLPPPAPDAPAVPVIEISVPAEPPEGSSVEAAHEANSRMKQPLE